MTEPDIALVERAPLRYLITTPASAGPAPALLCFLHGYDEAAPTEIRAALTRHGPLEAEARRLACPRFVVVAPQLPVAGDVWHRHEGALRQVVTEAREASGADPARMYLTGFSFGGNGVFDLCLAQPDLWAALWAVDPTRPPPRDPERPAWLSFGEVARSRKAAFLRALSPEPAGGNELGNRVYLDEGEDHVGSARRAYRDARIYDWLLSKRR